MSTDWKRQLFAQKGLWEIYHISRKAFPRSPTNRLIFWLAVVIFGALTVWRALFAHTQYQLTDSAAFVIAVSERLFSLSLGILGFLIAGFAIFASITNVNLFITLAKIPYKRGEMDQGISQLQFVFFNFLNVFTFYVALLATSTLILLLFSSGAPIADLNDQISTAFPQLASTTNCIAATGLVALVVNAMLKLKSFIWNLYQAALLSIAAEAHLREIEKEKEGTGASSLALETCPLHSLRLALGRFTPHPFCLALTALASLVLIVSARQTALSLKGRGKIFANHEKFERRTKGKRGAPPFE